MKCPVRRLVQPGILVGCVFAVLQVSAASDRPDDDPYQAHVKELRQRLPEGFYVVVEKPFVVIGDESADTVQRRSVQTVRWAVERLKRQYFEKDPNEIIEIWLFKNKDSYRKYSWELFRDRPNTPYGYYSPQHKALVMNISTGGGTLVHEIVHPFIASNFADCPSWFNEGLASLYEQCGDREGRIWGHTNWRLRGLQDAINKQQVPTFKELTDTSRREFYADDRGTNYAQARYLCYYLQERGKLVDFYRRFRDAAADDPTGYKTLVDVLGDPDMKTFQKTWENYVLKLRY